MDTSAEWEFLALAGLAKILVKKVRLEDDGLSDTGRAMNLMRAHLREGWETSDFLGVLPTFRKKP